MIIATYGTEHAPITTTSLLSMVDSLLSSHFLWGCLKMCHKHCKKLKKYIQINELAKFKSYIKRHYVDVIRLVDEQGNTLLHLSCKFGCEVILR